MNQRGRDQGRIEERDRVEREEEKKGLELEKGNKRSETEKTEKGEQAASSAGSPPQQEGTQEFAR